MNAPFAPPRASALPPIPLIVLAEAAANAWARDRRNYKRGCCDDPAPIPCCWHLFDGDTASVRAVRITLGDGSPAYVRQSEIDEARAVRRPSFPLPEGTTR